MGLVYWLHSSTSLCIDSYHAGTQSQDLTLVKILALVRTVHSLELVTAQGNQDSVTVLEISITKFPAG